GRGGTATAAFTWNITHTNRRPTVTAVAPQTSAEGQAVALPIPASDPDGDRLSFSATGLPAGLTINSTTGGVSGTVAFGAAPSNAVIVTASDGALSGSAAFAWTVTHTNRAPTADAASTATAEDTAAAIVLTGSDPDNDPVKIGRASC